MMLRACSVITSILQMWKLTIGKVTCPVLARMAELASELSSVFLQSLDTLSCLPGILLKQYGWLLLLKTMLSRINQLSPL